MLRLSIVARILNTAQGHEQVCTFVIVGSAGVSIETIQAFNFQLLQQ